MRSCSARYKVRLKTRIMVQNDVAELQHLTYIVYTSSMQKTLDLREIKTIEKRVYTYFVPTRIVSRTAMKALLEIV